MNRFMNKIRRGAGVVAALALFCVVGGMEHFRIDLAAGAAVCAMCLALIAAGVFLEETED